MQIHKLRHRLRIRLGLEHLPLGLELGPQLRMVLDDAVMHDAHPRRPVRMRIPLRRRPMRRPPRMTDPRRPRQRLQLQQLRQVDQFPRRPPPLDPVPHQRRDPRTVIAPIFKPPQRLQQQEVPQAPTRSRRRCRTSTASPSPSDTPEPGPGFTVCPARPNAIASAGTSAVITLPAATNDPSPSETGATSVECVPTNTPAPIMVRCLAYPS